MHDHPNARDPNLFDEEPLEDIVQLAATVTSVWQIIAQALMHSTGDRSADQNATRQQAVSLALMMGRVWLPRALLSVKRASCGEGERLELMNRVRSIGVALQHLEDGLLRPGASLTPEKCHYLGALMLRIVANPEDEIERFRDRVAELVDFRPSSDTARGQYPSA